MRVLSKIIATAAALGVSTTLSWAAEVLRFSSFEPPVAFVTQEILTPWAKEVTDASNGELTVQVFPGGALGRNPAQQLQLVEDGVVDIAWVIPGYTPGRFQEGTVAELPFLVPNSTAGSRAMWEMHEKGLFAGDFNKLKMLGIFVSYPNFIAATKSVREPEDLKGLNFRAPGPTMLSAVNTLGAIPIGGITGPSVAEAISRGLISGTFTQWGAVETFRMGDVITHYNTVPLGGTPMLVVMNRAKYEALPEGAKAAIDRLSGAAFSERFGTAFDAEMIKARARIEATGKVEVIDPDDDLAARWRNAVAIASQEWIANNENGQAIHDAFAAAIQASTAQSN